MENQEKFYEQLSSQKRNISTARTGDEDLGVFKLLPGIWRNEPNLEGRGWNMIALPFIANEGEPNLNYRLLLNQYNEELSFTIVDKAVPNRGIKLGKESINSDQFIATLDYTQGITQIAAEDFPVSGKAGGSDLPIHHEPGLFLQMANHFTDGLEIARLGSVPHGNALLALGRPTIIDGTPEIPDENGLPIGVDHDLASPYLEPYKRFHDTPFKNLFDPIHPNELLKEANQGINIVRTTELHFDTSFGSGGIHNIPFIEKQADATHMHVTFWIQELDEEDEKGNQKLRLQYSQTVFLEFFDRKDGKPGLIKWPHVSINTMEKVAELD